MGKGRVATLLFNVESNTSKLVSGMERAEASVAKLTKKMVDIAKSAVGLYAIQKAFTSIVESGFRFNKTLEESQAGLTALAVAVQDKNIPVQLRYINAQKEAISTLQQLQKINVQTPHTLDQTNQIYKAMYVSMKNVGASTTDLVELTRSLSIASGAAGIQFNSLLAGVDGLASGTVLANSDLGRFLNSLGLTNKKLKESKDVVTLVKDTLKDFKAADIMAVSLSNLENSWNQLTGELTKSTFEDAKKNITLLAGVLQEAAHWTHEFNIQLAETRDIKYGGIVEDMRLKLSQLNKELKDLNRGDWIGDNALKSAQQINAERIQLEHDIKTLTKKINKEVSDDAKDSLTKVSNFKRELTKEELKALKKYESMKIALSGRAAIVWADSEKEEAKITQAKYNLMGRAAKQWADSEKEDLKKSSIVIKDTANELNYVFTNAFKGMEDSLVSFVKTGKLDFKSLTDSIITDLIRMQIQQSITKPLMNSMTASGGIGGIIGSMFANGGVMSNQGSLPLKTYSNGGVATTPQVAIYGEGSMNEAYVPLPDGRTIPVTMQGGGNTPNVVLNIENNSGTQVENSNVSTSFDGGSLIVSVVLDAITRNKGGMRNAIKGVR